MMLPSEDRFPGVRARGQNCFCLHRLNHRFFVSGFRQGDGAEDFVEPAFFGVQFFDLPMFSRRELPDGGGQFIARRIISWINSDRGGRFTQRRQRSPLLNSLSFIFTAEASLFAIRTVTAPACADLCFSSSGVPLATIRPRSMMIAREQTASTSSRIWVEKMIAFFSPIFRIKVRTSCFWLGSSPSVGSSRINTAGS